MPQGSGRAGSTSRVTAAGGAAAFVAVLGIAEGRLDVLNLRPVVLTLLTVLLAALALLPGVFSAQRAQRADDAARDDRLDDALTCWPARTADELSAQDAGVHPSLSASGDPGAYLARPDVDDALRTALADVPILVALGPAGSGKSRSAFEALRAAMPDALLLIPEDADGLRTVLRQVPDLHLDRTDVVVWLDGLERFAGGADGDALARFLERMPPRRWRDRVLRRLTTAQAPRTRVVATVRTAALTALLDADGGDLGLRRLVARARGVEVPAWTNPIAPASWSAGWAAPRPSGGSGGAPGGSPAQRLRHRSIDVAPIGVGLLVAAAAAGLVLYVWILDFGVRQPRRVDEQVASLINKEDCPASASPAAGKGLVDNRAGTRDTLVLLVRGDGCGRSDSLRFYRLRNDRLKPVASLGLPATAPRQSFHCLGPGRADPCHVEVAGRTFVAGAFVDAETQRELPVAISFDDGMRVWPLSPPPAAVHAAPARVRAQARIQERLAMQVDGAPPATGPCVASGACVRGRRAAMTAVVPGDGRLPVTLVLAYPATGSVDAPETERLQVWALAVGPDGVPAIDRHRDCLVLRDGLVQRLTVSGTAKADELQRQWDGRRRLLMC